MSEDVYMQARLLCYIILQHQHFPVNTERGAAVEYTESLALAPGRAAGVPATEIAAWGDAMVMC